MFSRTAIVALTLGVAACSAADTTAADGPSAANAFGADAAAHSTAALSGNWRGSSGGVTIEISITTAGDSVHGTGTFSRADPFTMGCGAASLPKSGTVELAVAVRGDTMSGHFKTSSGWSPPFSATHFGTDTIAGAFLSVDRGPCAYTLVRRR